MPQVSYPGVYIQEIPSAVRTIASVSTSITAFVDFFREGPMDKAVQIFGMADFDRIYGGIDSRSEASYAISQFFLNGGSEAYVVRVANQDTVVGAVPVSASVSIKADTSGAGTQILRVTAANQGAWGNTLRVDIDHNTADPDNLFNFYVTRYTSADGTARGVVSEKFLGLSVTAGPRFAESVINEESKLVRVTVLSSTDIPAATGTLSDDISALATADFNGLSGGTFNVAIGASGVKLATLDTWPAGTVTNLRQFRAFLERAIRKADTTSAAFTNATVELVDESRFRISAGRGAAGYAPSQLVAITATANAAATTLQLTAAAGAENNVQEYSLGFTPSVAALVNGVAGVDGLLPGATEIVGSQGVEPHTGMFALDYADLFNILCIPRAANLTDPAMNTVVSSALTYCSARRAFMIVDIPKTVNEVQEMKDWMDTHGGFRHPNAAIYFPRPRMPDPKDEFRLRSVGASGTLAGVYARTDSQRGVWKTPAGIEAILMGIPELDAKLSDGENGTLNPLGINCLRTFPIYGNISWGGRTLVGADAQASEWKYLAVRRLALMIEESLFRGTKWVVFEGNDEKLWGKVRLNVGAFMMGLFRQGAFQGTDPKAAFYVKCDKETTTQADINLGIVNIEVGFAPLKPAEFVVIKIQQMAGDLE
jgi:phage tail sheath protein FI